MDELWKSVTELPTSFEVSNMGNVREAWGDGHYEDVHQTSVGEYLAINFRGKQYRIHRLVAEAFVEKPASLPNARWTVKHIDGDKHNNVASNLQWIDSTSEYLSRGSLKIIRCIYDGNVFNSILCASTYYAIPAPAIEASITNTIPVSGLQFEHLSDATYEDCQFNATVSQIIGIYTGTEPVSIEDVRKLLAVRGKK